MQLTRSSLARSVFIAGLLSVATAASAAVTISEVRWSQTQVNPTIGGGVVLSFSLSLRASTAVTVTDLEGRVVRTLATKAKLDAGRHEFSWDGRDDAGQIAPDGVYLPRVELTRQRSSVAQRAAAVKPILIPVRYYDRRAGTIAYDLPAASLVTVVANAQTAGGASVSKLVATGVARPGGAVIEAWDGLDDTGAAHIPDLPGFTIRIEATPLPKDAVIAYGERSAANSASAADANFVSPSANAIERGTH